MNETRTRSVPLLVGVALLLASFGLYLSTLAPTLTWGLDNRGVDGGELLAAANTFGIPHPPGYPTYTLLLKSFATVVPVGDFAYRGNLLSAVLASAAVFVLYWACLRVCRSLKPDAPQALAVIGAALGSALFAASPLFWSQAIITEVYALNALFVSVLLLLATHMALGPRQEETAGALLTVDPKLVLFAFLLGLGLGNHLTLLAVAVPMLYWLWPAVGWKSLVSPWTVAAFILGAAIYVYLPLRAAEGPPVNWGDADTLSGMAWMLSGGPYQEYVFGVPAESVRERVLSWLDLVFAQFNPLGLFFGLIVVGQLRAWAPRFFVSTLVSIGLLSIYSVSYNTVDFEVLMVPAFLLFSVWVAAGFFWIMATWIRDFTEGGGPAWLRVELLASHQVLLLSVLGFLLLPGMSVVLNYGSQNLRDDRGAYEYASSVLDAVPDGSVVLSDGEVSAFSLWYMRYVDRPERDVATIVAPLLQFDWYRRDIHRMFPDRIPAITPTQYPNVLDIIVRHNNGGAPVYFTYRFPSATVELTRLDTPDLIYEATVK